MTFLVPHGSDFEAGQCDTVNMQCPGLKLKISGIVTQARVHGTNVKYTLSLPLWIINEARRRMANQRKNINGLHVDNLYVKVEEKFWKMKKHSIDTLMEIVKKPGTPKSQILAMIIGARPIPPARGPFIGPVPHPSMPANDQQSAAIAKAYSINAPLLQLIVGPPGTGKTSTTVQLIAYKLHRDPKMTCLIANASHRSANHIAVKLQEALQHLTPEAHILRVMNHTRELMPSSPDLKPLTLNGLLQCPTQWIPEEEVGKSVEYHRAKEQFFAIDYTARLTPEEKKARNKKGSDLMTEMNTYEKDFTTELLRAPGLRVVITTAAGAADKRLK